jgi:tripartite-type tricarboxylate transporter receptor subunit TctC
MALAQPQRSRVAGEAQAQNWPTKPIKFVVAYPAGGGADFIARLFSERMSKLLEQPIVVENRPGAGGTLGALSVVRAEPDGYTLLIAAISEISIAPAPTRRSPTIRRRTSCRGPARPLAADPGRVADFPPNTLSEFIAYVKANPGKVSYSSVRQQHPQPRERRALQGRRRHRRPARALPRQRARRSPT